MSDIAIILAGAFLLDVLIGDPAYRWHPVRLMGDLAARLEVPLFRIGAQGAVGGLFFWIAMITVTAATYGAIRYGLVLVSPWVALLFDIFVLYSCIALTDLVRHTLPVQQALEKGDLAAARAAVGRIVGRETRTLDNAAISRAAVESVAENFVDGFFSPLVWYTAAAAAADRIGGDAAYAGVTAAVIYRTANTLDAMVGHKNRRYAAFGFVSAKSDDLLNYIPARLSVVFLFLAATLTGLSPIGGLSAWYRHRNKTLSPNAGQSESFAAGALGIRLGGPITYPYGTFDKPWLGFGDERATRTHIGKCSRLVTLAGWMAVGVAIGYFLIFLK
jgi:adenosylcobinamide-phosphate synthase